VILSLSSHVQSIPVQSTCKSHRALKRNFWKCFSSFLSPYLAQAQAGKQAGRVTTTPTDSWELAWAAQGLDGTISPVAQTTCCRLQGVLRGLDERRKEGKPDHAVCQSCAAAGMTQRSLAFWLCLAGMTGCGMLQTATSTAQPLTQ